MANIGYTQPRAILKSEGIILTDRMIPAFKKSLSKIGVQRTLEKYRNKSDTIHIIKDMNEALSRSNDPEQIDYIKRRFDDKTFMKNLSYLEHGTYDKAFKERFISLEGYSHRYDWREGLIDSIKKTLKYRVSDEQFEDFENKIRALSIYKDRKGIDELFAERKYFYKNVTLDIDEYTKFLTLIGYNSSEIKDIIENTKKDIIDN